MKSHLTNLIFACSMVAFWTLPTVSHASMLTYLYDQVSASPPYASQLSQGYTTLPQTTTTSASADLTSASVTFHATQSGSSEIYDWSHSESTNEPHFGDANVSIQFSFLPDTATQFTLTNTWSNSLGLGQSAYGGVNLNTHTTLYDFGPSPYNTLSIVFDDPQTTSTHSGILIAGHYYNLVSTFEVKNNSFLFDPPSLPLAALGDLTLTTQAVPEPSTLSLFTLGGIAAAIVSWRRRRRMAS
jgi:hypothetical protein